MKRHVNVKQLEPWLDKLEKNMSKIPKDKEERLAFIRHQYLLLETTAGVISGKVQLVGVKQPEK